MLQTWLYASLIQTQISQQQLAQSFDFDNYFSSSATLSPFFFNILNKMSQQLLDGLPWTKQPHPPLPQGNISASICPIAGLSPNPCKANVILISLNL